MLYIRSDDLVPLQYMLQRMMMNIQTLLDAMQYAPSMVDITDLPGENLRLAHAGGGHRPHDAVLPLLPEVLHKGYDSGSS